MGTKFKYCKKCARMMMYKDGKCIMCKSSVYEISNCTEGSPYERSMPSWMR